MITSDNMDGRVADVIATAGIPAPLVVSYLDETAKFAALVYSILGAIYMIKRLFLKGGKDD